MRFSIRRGGSGGDVESWAGSLALYLRAGVSLRAALETQAVRGYKLAEEVNEQLARGHLFVEGLRCLQSNLVSWELSMLEAFENAGRLEAGLEHLSEHRRLARRRKQALAGMMIYPAILVVVGGLVTLFLTHWVFPRLFELFEHMLDTGELPWITARVLEIGHLPGIWSLLCGMGVPLLAGFLIVMIDRYRPLREYRELVFRRFLPEWNPIVLRRKAHIARSLGVLLESGAGMANSVNNLKMHEGSRWCRQCLETFQREIESGRGILESLDSSHLFAEADGPLLEAGERGGRLPEVLMLIAREADNRMEDVMNQGIRLLEPLILLILSILVGLLLLSFLLPMVQVLQEGRFM